MSVKKLTLLTSFFLMFGTACNNEKLVEQVVGKALKKTIKKSLRSAKKAVEDDETYTVSLPKNGSALVITPKAGFKMNADFPHRAIFTAADIKETAEAQRSDKSLSFTAPAESKLPKQGVNAEASFSVCNDQMCKLYKENYQW